MIEWYKRSLRIGVHLTNGSPVYLGGQLHIGLWLLTWHWALSPHVPGHGSMHFWLLQAWSLGQSELTVHSGLQDGGLPMYPGTHEHTACWFIVRHWLFGPQGDGLHGFSTTGSMGKIYRIVTLSWNKTKRVFANKVHTSERWTLNECISAHSYRAAAHRHVVIHIAKRILATSSWTRIDTFVSDASSIERTICVKNTFWSTARIRISVVFRQTCASAVIAYSIRPTRGRIAGVCIDRLNHYKYILLSHVLEGVWIIT